MHERLDLLMSIREHLTALVIELKYIHSEAFSWGKEQGFPALLQMKLMDIK